MLRDSGHLGQIITFYSYKGGTGRSMALANVACYLARTGKVLVIDWDLEAPGLHYYFGLSRNLLSIGQRSGLLELFEGYRDLSVQRSNTPDAIDLDDFIIETSTSNLFFMKAGRLDATYSRRVLNFDWETLHNKQPILLRSFAETLMERFDYVLIDSRTGISDTSGICTALMPEKLVVVFTLNSQNIDGGIQSIKNAIEYRKQSDDTRPLMVFPLPSRIEMLERRLMERWRFSQPTASTPTTGYQPLFESLISDLYGLDVELTNYFDEIKIQHDPQYSYGEEIAVQNERGDRLSLSRSYIDFAEVLRQTDAPWDIKQQVKSYAIQPTHPEEFYSIDEEWFGKHEAKAEKGLTAINFNGYVEFRASLLTDRPNATQGSLLDAARISQIKSFGWPIGVIIDTPEFTPRPVKDGIVAELAIDKGSLGPSYDYWTIRNNGDCFILQSYFEDSRVSNRIFFDVRVIRLAEALLYCSRVYRRLNVPSKARVSFALKLTGLKARTLVSGNPMRMLDPRGSVEEQVENRIVASLDSVSYDLAGIVKELVAPLFVIFDFLQLSDKVYSDLVGGFLKDVQNETPKTSLLKGFRLDLEGLRLFAENTHDGRWIAKVYDLKKHVTIYETYKPDSAAAKLEAATAAFLNIYGPSAMPDPESAAVKLQWEEYSRASL